MRKINPEDSQLKQAATFAYMVFVRLEKTPGHEQLEAERHAMDFLKEAIEAPEVAPCTK